AARVHYREFAAHREREAAYLSDLVWRELRGRPVYIDVSWHATRPSSLDVALMYGMDGRRLTSATFERIRFAANARIGFLLRHDLVGKVRDLARRTGASLRQIGSLE